MSESVYIALTVAYFGSIIMGAIHRQTALWWWTAAATAVVLAGWSFLVLHFPLASVLWLAYVGIWSWVAYRRVKSLARH